MASLRHIATEPSLHKALTVHPPVPETMSQEAPESEGNHSLHSSSACSHTMKTEMRRSPLIFPSLPSHGPNGPPDHESAESEKSTFSNRSLKNKPVDVHNRRSSEWEILEGLKEGQKYEQTPTRFEGFLLKRRKWPLKGWHKRYFCLDKGTLTYCKSPVELAKGKMTGSVDVGLSVISTKYSSKRIDIDAEEFIYHIKTKTTSQFTQWVAQLRHHRLFRQHEITFGNKIKPVGLPSAGIVGMASICSPVSESNSKVANWILGSTVPYDEVYKELADLQVKLIKLSSLLQVIEMQMGTRNEMPDVDSGSLKKYRKRFLLRRHKKTASTPTTAPPPLPPPAIFLPPAPFASKPPKTVRKQGTIEILVACDESVTDSNLKLNPSTSLATALTGSHPALNEAELKPYSLPERCGMTRSFTEVGKSDTDTSTGSTGNIHQINQTLTNNGTSAKTLDDFLALASEVHCGLRTCMRAVQTERENGRGKDTSYGTHATEGMASMKVIASLQHSLQEALQQNATLKLRLNRIHEDSDTADFCPMAGVRAESNASVTDEEAEEEPTIILQPIGGSRSYESCSVLSVSEYFDAYDKLSVCSTSTEDEDDGHSFATELSEEDGAELSNSLKLSAPGTSATGRRSKLPAPKPDIGDVSLWGLLCKNIGKDLSKISMPVTLNEPLNMLQRLCEELEYSELLEKAASIDSPCERMLYVAAFAVSAYGSSCYRAGHKPFNPLLRETYECIREDKGFRFVSEQVSHHPPVSASHAESDAFLFWQDMRIKTKFWGKSMEIIPFGTVHVLLKRTNSHYKWNKVTTCVHNIFKGQRSVDQYGEMTISDGDLRCKLTFVKATYWSTKRHEVYGVITNRAGDVIEHVFGKWNEALYCGVAPSARCIWRPGAMPDDYELYYGFSRFAIELNELNDHLVGLLPPTDTRFRPDQRLLEESNIQAAESAKTKLEQLQREKRKHREATGEGHVARWFGKEQRDGEDIWSFTGEYWKLRADPGFAKLEFDNLWPLE